MSLKKDVFRCTVVYDHEQKESAPIEIDAKRVNNTVTLSLVITNQTPEKGLIPRMYKIYLIIFIEIELTEESEVCRKREDVILGDHALTFKFETEEQAKSFRKFIDFRFDT